MRNPFSAGRWVVGEHFFGRDKLIRSLLESNESCDWIIGKRRIGKTSLLRQLEKILNSEVTDCFGLYWDIQGSFDSSGLLDSLLDAIEDNQDLFEDAWEHIHVDTESSDSCPQLLKRLARAFQKTGRKFFLLIDEAEELISVGNQDSSVLKKMRRFFQSSQETHTIITSTPRLEQLYSTMETETSPFLHGFTVSFLGNLDQESCNKLLAQGLPREEDRDMLFRLTDGNPFEAQLLAKHYFENNNMDEVLAHLESNPMLNQTIEVNLDLLDDTERAMLHRLHESPGDEKSFDKSTISKLLHMGYLRYTHQGNLEVGSWFQARNLGLTPSMEPETGPAIDDGHPLINENRSVILGNILEIYRILLNLSQQGRQPDITNGRFIWFSRSKNTVFLQDGEMPTIETAPRPWMPALVNTMSYLDQHIGEIESWPYFRMMEMQEEGTENYTEKDFLDLMVLIAEEAALDARLG